MPPSRHSNSTRGPHNDSNAISPGESYTLGKYTFTIQNIVSEGERVIQAHCSGPEGNAAKGITVEESTKLISWTVEANETEATVYATVQKRGQGTGGKVAEVGDVIGYYNDMPEKINTISSTGTESPIYLVGTSLCSITDFTGNWIARDEKGLIHASGTLGGRVVSYQGTQFYYDGDDSGIEAAYNCLYGYGDPESVLVGRFEINIDEADGSGEDSPWDEADDEDEDDEKTTTLNINITGALSGRHNDPLNDTSYSYLPADKATVKPYGYGGDGGNGGGGGGGASTVIVYKFATSKADSKDFKVYTLRHGYGSGGGKGGKGGDGIVLVYY